MIISCASPYRKRNECTPDIPIVHLRPWHAGLEPRERGIGTRGKLAVFRDSNLVLAEDAVVRGARAQSHAESTGSLQVNLHFQEIPCVG